MNRKWLVDIRTNKKLTQQDVANLSGIDRSFYTQIENGSRNPSVDTAKKIAGVLNFEWAIFFSRPCAGLFIWSKSNYIIRKKKINRLLGTRNINFDPNGDEKGT